MALYETLIEGGHEHLIDAVKARIAQKADAIIEDELKPIIENQPSATLEGELLMADDVADMPSVMVHVGGRSTQLTTTGKNLANPVGQEWLAMRLSNNGYGTVVSSGGTYCRIWPVIVEAGQSITYSCDPGMKMGFHLAYSTEYPALGVVLNNIVTLTNYSRYTWKNTTEGTVYVCLTRANSSMLADAFMRAAQLQLERATEFTSYEPYSGGVASPSISWPQQIVSIDALSLSICGKNLVYDSVDAWESGAINSSGEEADNSTRIRMADYMPLPSGITYTLSVSSDWHTNAVCVFDRDKRFVTRFLGVDTNVSTFANPANGAYIRIVIGKVDDPDITPADITSAQPMLVAGSTSQPYEKHVGEVVPINLQGNVLHMTPYGTKDELTISYLRPSSRNGYAIYSVDLFVRTGEVDFGNLSWGGNNVGKAAEKWYTTIADMRSNVGVNQRMCSTYTPVSSKGTNQAMDDNTVAPRSVDDVSTLYVKDSRYSPATTTANDFKAAVTGVKYVYLLKQSYQRHIDLGTVELPVLPSKHAAIWSDDIANLKLIYVIDSETIEESLETGISKGFSSIAPVETSPATDNHDAGSRIVYNETLYKVTSAIAAGEDIVPGTNVTATTVAAELLATQA